MEHLNIAICDDNHAFVNELEALLQTALCKQHYNIEIYNSPKNLIEKLAAHHNYDMVFLDIEFCQSDINGVVAGKIIREGNAKVSIVFVSSEPNYSIELHDIQPLNFLVKPLNLQRVQKVLDQHRVRNPLMNQYFTYKLNRNVCRTSIDDIVYVESAGRNLKLHLVNGKTVVLYGSLKEAYCTQLSQYNFIQIHASYAVNYKYISRYSTKEITLAPKDVVLPVTQSKRVDVSRHIAGVLAL